MATALVIGLANSGNEFAEAVVTRALSVEEEGGEESSMGARYHENREAIEPIMDNFVLGLGHGGEYKKRLDPDPKFVEQAMYIHNGYLYIQLKYGIFGTVALLLLLGTVAVVTRTVQRLTPPEDPWFWRSQAAMACVIAFCVNAITSPVWVEFGPTTGLACASSISPRRAGMPTDCTEEAAAAARSGESGAGGSSRTVRWKSRAGRKPKTLDARPREARAESRRQPAGTSSAPGSTASPAA